MKSLVNHLVPIAYIHIHIKMLMVIVFINNCLYDLKKKKKLYDWIYFNELILLDIVWLLFSVIFLAFASNKILAFFFIFITWSFFTVKVVIQLQSSPINWKTLILNVHVLLLILIFIFTIIIDNKIVGCIQLLTNRV